MTYRYVGDNAIDALLGAAKLDCLKQVSPGVWEFHTSEPYND